MWNKLIDFFRKLFSKHIEEATNPEVIEEPIIIKPKEWEKEDLLSPILHSRYVTLYCIADLTEGNTPIYTANGKEIARISTYSLSRLNMEGTGRLSDGRVINVGSYSNGWTYVIMGEDSPFGMGIKGQALKPWFSVAHQLSQLNNYSLFKRQVVIPELVGFNTPDNLILNGTFEIHDTGGGLRECPYEKGLWRTGYNKSNYGQFDLFVGAESVYKTLLGSWPSYFSAFVLPRDLTSDRGKQEALNLLMDSGLNVDGVIGPLSKVAIQKLNNKAGLEDNEIWTEETTRYINLSLKNY